MPTQHPQHPWTDNYFLVALIAAPVVWALLFSGLQPAIDLTWPSRAPGRFLLLVLAYPVLEEVVFRGAVQGALLARAHARRAVYGLTLANLYTSLIFTALHFFSHPPVWAISVMVPSLVFGYFRDRHGRIATPIALHVFYNAGFFWIFARGNG